MGLIPRFLCVKAIQVGLIIRAELGCIVSQHTSIISEPWNKRWYSRSVSLYQDHSQLLLECLERIEIAHAKGHSYQNGRTIFLINGSFGRKARHKLVKQGLARRVIAQHR